LREVNWATAGELELFLEPFHETVQMFAERQPHFHRVKM
jgi:hypothetical protein